MTEVTLSDVGMLARAAPVIDAIRNWIREHGYPPTIRELGKQLGIKSLRGVTTHLDAIGKKGFLKRESRARSIRLLEVMAPFERALRVPIVGHIQAGKTVLAEEQVQGHVVVDASWVGATPSADSPHFALRVQGESMINAGILDGDYVIVRQQQTAESRDIVVALLEDEATVKRFMKDGDQIRLQPEHPTMEPILVSPGTSFAILGKVVAVFRTIP